MEGKTFFFEWQNLDLVVDKEERPIGERLEIPGETEE